MPSPTPEMLREIRDMAAQRRAAAEKPDGSAADFGYLTMLSRSARADGNARAEPFPPRAPLPNWQKLRRARIAAVAASMPAAICLRLEEADGTWRHFLLKANKAARFAEALRVEAWRYRGAASEARMGHPLQPVSTHPDKPLVRHETAITLQDSNGIPQVILDHWLPVHEGEMLIALARPDGVVHRFVLNAGEVEEVGGLIEHVLKYEVSFALDGED